MPKLPNTVPNAFTELVDSVLDEQMTLTHEEISKVRQDLLRATAGNFLVFEIPDVSEHVKVRDATVTVYGRNLFTVGGQPDPERMGVGLQQMHKKIKDMIHTYTLEHAKLEAVEQAKAYAESRKNKVAQEVAKIREQYYGIGFTSESELLKRADAIINELAERRVTEKER